MKRALTSLLTIFILSSLLGITVYAIGTGETTQPVSITTYHQQAVKTMGNWEQQSDGTWKFKCYSGSYLINSWLESLVEENAFYFVDASGTMLTNTVTPDNYKLDSTGLWKIGTASAPAVTESTVPQTQASVESVPAETAPQNMDRNDFDALNDYYDKQLESMKNNEELMNEVYKYMQ